jgi:hypothetical protein
MTQSRSVTASFTAPTQNYTLTVGGSGTGSGSVTSSPNGINCSITAGSTSGTCSASFTDGTSVTLTATAASGHSFSGWSGACSGTGSCTVSMTQSRSVTASFTAPAQSYTLTVGGSGTGNGSVTSSPSGINCSIMAGSTSGTCSASFTDGTSATLTATAASGQSFSGWSGACSGTGGCTVSMTQSRSVTASFTAPVPSAPTLISPPNGAITTFHDLLFRWHKPAYAYGYEIQVDDNPSFDTQPEIWQWGMTDTLYIPTTYEKSLLAEDGTYYWRVRGANSAGDWGAWSSTWSFTLDQFVGLRITLDSLYVIADGDATGNGELYWDFVQTNTNTTISYRLRDQALSVSTGSTYRIGEGRTFDWERGWDFSIRFEFSEADVVQDDYLGYRNYLYLYDGSTGQWSGIGSLSEVLTGSEAQVRVFWTLRRTY